jgi:hypothetical protein
MTWTCKLTVTPSEMQLLVRRDNDLLKVRLPAQARHLGALLRMLEGLASWSGSAICAAISADELVQIGCVLRLFGDGLWAADNQLVRFDPAGRVSPRHLRGMSDFRSRRQRQRRCVAEWRAR